MKEALNVHKGFINQEGTRHFQSILDRNAGLVWSTYGAAVKVSNSLTVSL
jgi:hypothetical protein